jgi:hypothetical protein
MSVRSGIDQVRSDSRSPALWLLILLILSVCFFTIGFMVGRWTDKDCPTHAPSSSSNQTINPR